jgi:hypothetical protein
MLSQKQKIRITLTASAVLALKWFDQLLFYDKISAIIGAGIGGASTAHFLRKDFGSDADITIFEKGQVGFQPLDINRRAPLQKNPYY